MCLSIPGKVIAIEGNIAKTSIGGTIIDAGLQLVDNVKVGDYILVHTGFAIQKIDEQEAIEQLHILDELKSNEIY
jgi:hydrogenase expression/formation protein HypC